MDTAPHDVPQTTPTFGALLRRFRLAAGISQELLAERAGLSVQALSALENGRRQVPYRHTVTLLAQALGLSADAAALLEAAVVRGRMPATVAPATGRQDPECSPEATMACDSTPGARASQPTRTNLPLALTSFIGREQEMDEVPRLLGDTRLLTLTGTGGVGKTRLALQVAADLLDRYAEGVWLVELAPLADPALVPGAVLKALGAPEQPGHPPEETLLETLRPRQVLLLLDNCEHLLDACARLSRTLLGACPRVRILATSREPLGLAGETRWRVPSLSLPAPDQRLSPELVARCEAVALFLGRARAVQPAFALTAANMAAVAGLCTRLDGIPLALELAAARLSAFGVADLVARLDQRFRLLTGGNRALLPRQRTLQATVAWSYDLLTPPEQRCFARLSVFAGGWSLEAAEVVAAGGAIMPGEVPELLASLVNKSLALAAPRDDGSMRYRLLETLRQFGWEQLGAGGEREAVRQRHASYYLDRAETAARYLHGPDQATWLDRLERDHDNLRAALAWAIEWQDGALGLRLAASLWDFWYYRGHFSEGRALLAAALALPTGPDQDVVRARVLHGEGTLARSQGDFVAARAASDAAVAIARRLGDRHLLAKLLTSLGFVARAQQDYGTARAALEEGLPLAREVGDSRDTAVALHHLGLLALEADRDYAAAWSLNEQSLELFRRSGNRRMVGIVLWALARVARARGDPAGARALLADALTALREVGDPMIVLMVLHTLAATEALAGRPERAVQVLAAATAMEERLGARVWPVLLDERDAWLGQARQALGAPGFARAWSTGQAMRGEEALADALADLSSAQGAPPPHPPAPGGAPIVGAPAARARAGRRLSRAERLAWALEHLRTVGPLSPREYMAALGIERRTAVRDLRTLEERGLVVAQGTTTDRRYALRRDRP
jgi:non-specific serine/threonine protein kinase